MITGKTTRMRNAIPATFKAFMNQPPPFLLLVRASPHLAQKG